MAFLILTFCRTVFETVKEKIHNCIVESLDYYESQCKKELSIEELCSTTAVDPSLSECIEWLQRIDNMYEKEYWHKRALIDSICYESDTADQTVDMCFEKWTSEPHIQNVQLQEIFPALLGR